LSGSSPKVGLIGKDLVDYAARIGVAAKFDGVDKSQLEKLIASLDFVSDERISIYVSQAYVNRQVSRREIGNTTGRLVIEALEKCADKSQARALLGLAKWIFEGAKAVNFKNIRRDNVDKITFEDYIKEVKR